GFEDRAHRALSDEIEDPIATVEHLAGEVQCDGARPADRGAISARSRMNARGRLDGFPRRRARSRAGVVREPAMRASNEALAHGSNLRAARVSAEHRFAIAPS